MAQLPPGVMQEAQHLRQEALAQRQNALRQQQQAVRADQRQRHRHGGYHREQLFGAPQPRVGGANPQLKNRDGQQILDQEHLNLLLWTLFSPSLYYAKPLCAVFKRLCAHSKTRNYIISSLISICEQLADTSYGAVDDVPAQVQLLLKQSDAKVAFRSKPSVVKLSLEILASILGSEARAAVAFLGDARTPPMTVGRKASFWVFLLDLAAGGKELPKPVMQLRAIWSNRKRRSRSNSLGSGSTPALDVLFKVLAIAPGLEEARILPEAMKCLGALFSTLPTHTQKAQYEIDMAKFKKEHPEESEALLSPNLRRSSRSLTKEGSDAQPAPTSPKSKDDAKKPTPPTAVLSFPVLGLEHADRLLAAIEVGASEGVRESRDSKILAPLVRSQDNAQAVVQALQNHIFDWRDKLQDQVGRLEAIIVQAAAGVQHTPAKSGAPPPLQDVEEQSIEDSVDLRQHLSKMTAPGSAQNVLLRLLKMASHLQADGVVNCPCMILPKKVDPSKQEGEAGEAAAAPAETVDPSPAADGAAAPSVVQLGEGDGAVEQAATTTAATSSDAAVGDQPPATTETGTQETKEAGKEEQAEKGDADDESSLPKLDELVASYKIKPVELVIDLETLWSTIGFCLSCLDRYKNSDQIVSSLEPIVEAFLYCHQDVEPFRRSPSAQPASAASTPASLARAFSFNAQLGPQTEQGRDREKRFVQFLETHRAVINDVIKKTPKLLGREPFSILAKFPMVLDFDVKEKFFRDKLQSSSQYRAGRVRLRIRREYLFEDSYNQVIRLAGNQLNARFDIQFVGEEGIDAGGLLREWYYKLSQAMMNPNYALFCQSTPGSEQYQPNLHSSINADHLQYFRFCGRVVAKAIYDNQLLDCHFTRAFYKQILGLPVSWRDLGAVDESLYKNLLFVLDNDMTPLEVGCQARGCACACADESCVVG